MSDGSFSFLPGQYRSNWIRLRTMILLRWVAIVGQLAALLVAMQIYNLQVELGLCLLAIGVSVIGNLVAIFVFPENKRLSETENLLMVVFDLCQLCFLLYLTGGLHNPFALLVLAPVTVSASVLTLRSVLILAGLAMIFVTLLAQFHFPLRTEQGFILRIPDVFIFGKWTAIMIGLVFLSLYSRWVTQEMHSMSDALTATQMALSREQKLTDLGGVVAAYAHELGTPLATIKLTSAELMEDLDDHPSMQEDAALIRDQADRCRDILRSMGQVGKDDLHLRQAPLSEVIRHAAEPHQERGKLIHFEELPNASGMPQPSILRRPEIIHGIRNLVQNAVDFARANVWVEAIWSDTEIQIRIIDDGPGYPSHLIGRIGDPFMRRRKSEKTARPGYEGMGLGLFIAKTLLERTGAELSFANGSDPFLAPEDTDERSGAIVQVTWPRRKIDAVSGDHAIEIGLNQPIKV